MPFNGGDSILNLLKLEARDDFLVFIVLRLSISIILAEDLDEADLVELAPLLVSVDHFLHDLADCRLLVRAAVSFKNQHSKVL